ncbi:MAG: glycosyltransferase [Muribaculaceae bacterium]|nr:glycosyltransferase [Muribaculaceae bacterium]
MSKISVVIPVWNAAKWIGSTLDSLGAQTHTDFEAIMIDDGSTDDSAEICRRYCAGDPRFRLVQQVNAGVSAARNRGIEESSGDLLTFLDADDMLPPDSLAVMLRLHDETGAAIVAGRYLRTSDPERLCREWTGKDSATAKHEVAPSDEAIRRGLYQKRIFNYPGGILYAHDVLRGSGAPRFRDCRYEDLDFFYRAFERAGEICVTDAVTCLYRDTPGSFMNSWSASRLDVLDVTDRIERHFSGRDAHLLRAARDRRFSAHYNMLVEMIRHGVGNPEQERRCLSVIRDLRSGILADPEVRIKNKIGALISYLGTPAIRLISRLSPK